MEYFITQFEKVLSTTISFDIQSSPHFSIEVFFAAAFCLIQIIILVELNSFVENSNTSIVEDLRAKRLIIDMNKKSQVKVNKDDSKSDHSKTSSIRSLNLSYKKLNRKLSMSNYRFMVPPCETPIKSRYTDLMKGDNEYVEYFLSITPSEYIRRYREEKRREGLNTCIQSLTNMLEKSVNQESVMEHITPDTIQKSLNTIRESFRAELSDEWQNAEELANPSLQSLIARLIFLSNKKSNTALTLPPQSGCEQIQYSCTTDENGFNLSVDSEKLQNVENYFVDATEEITAWPSSQSTPS